MINMTALLEFATPYYSDKDIMHNMWHIELIKKQVNNIIALGHYKIDMECLTLAIYFHGFIYLAENEIRQWLKEQQYTEEAVEKVVTIAWESQRPEVPETIEGKILHDAHILEGGKTYLVVKTLITGSVRGQTLLQTLGYMKENVLWQNKCYLPETIPLCDEMNEFTDQFYQELSKGIQ